MQDMLAKEIEAAEHHNRVKSGMFNENAKKLEREVEAMRKEEKRKTMSQRK